MGSNAFEMTDGKVLGISRDHQRYALGGFSVLAGLFLLFSVAFSRSDMALFGTLGAAVKNSFTLLFGQFTAYLFPLLSRQYR